MAELDLDAIKARYAHYGPKVQDGTAVADVRALLAEVERLRARLEAAEQVCILFGWTSLGDNSTKSKAVEQAWQDWANAYGSISPTPEWRQRIKELAQRRDEIRARTLAAIRSELSDGAL